jgi:hypothetical protein
MAGRIIIFFWKSFFEREVIEESSFPQQGGTIEVVGLSLEIESNISS